MDSTLTNPPTTTRRSILLTIIFVAVCLVALYYLYRFLYTTASIQKTIVIGSEIPANIVPTSLPAIPALYEGGEYTVSVWIYVNSYNINRNSRKHVLEIGGAQFSTLLIALGAFKNTVAIRVHSADAVSSVEGYQDFVPSGLLGLGGQFDINSDGYTDACPKGSFNIYTGQECKPHTGARGPPDNYPSDVRPRNNSGNAQLKSMEELQAKLRAQYVKGLNPAQRAEYEKMYPLGAKIASGNTDPAYAYNGNPITEWKDLQISNRNQNRGNTGASGNTRGEDTQPTSTDTPNSSDSTTNGSLTRANVDSFFKPLALDDSILTTSAKCDLPEIDMQRWTLLTVNLNGRTTDVYLDGKLARSCVNKSYYKVDPTGIKMNVCDYGGFDGYLAGLNVYSYSLTPSDIYSIYVGGPSANGTSDIFSWLFSPFRRT